MKKTNIALALATVLAAGSVQAATTHTMTDGRFDFKDAGGIVTSDGHDDVQGAFDMINGTGSFTTSTEFSGFLWNADVVEMNMNSSFVDGVGSADEANSFAFNVREFFSASQGSISCVSVPTAGYDDCAQYTDIAFEGKPGGTDFSYDYLLQPGQFAAHTLFDWSSSNDIPVLAIMQVTSTSGDPMNPTMNVASVDLNGQITGNPFGTNTDPSTTALYGVPMYDCEAETTPSVACGPFPTQTAIFSGTIVPESAVIPVPAAVWLFGSGLLGLVGVARRRAA